MQLTYLNAVFPAENMIIGAVFLVVFIAENILYIKLFGTGGHEKKIKEAAARGHVVTAVLTSDTKYRMEGKKGNSSPEYYARYEYQVNGRTYSKTERFTSKPPRTITLFYLDDPGKTLTKSAPASLSVFPMLLIAIVVAAAVKILLF